MNSFPDADSSQWRIQRWFGWGGGGGGGGGGGIARTAFCYSNPPLLLEPPLLLAPPFESKLFHYHGEFYEKLGKFNNSNPVN